MSWYSALASSTKDHLLAWPSWTEPPPLPVSRWPPEFPPKAECCPVPGSAVELRLADAAASAGSVESSASNGVVLPASDGRRACLPKITFMRTAARTCMHAAQIRCATGSCYS